MKKISFCVKKHVIIDRYWANTKVTNTEMLK